MGICERVVRAVFGVERVRVWRINRPKSPVPEPMSDGPTTFLLTKRRKKALNFWVEKSGTLPLFLSDDPDVLAHEVNCLLDAIHISDHVAYDMYSENRNYINGLLEKMRKRDELKLKILKALANSIANIEAKRGPIEPIPTEPKELTND